MTRTRPVGDKASTFRLVHDGEEFLVLSEAAGSKLPTPLSAAELEVARALVRGESNAEIARGRGTSPRTVANQVASILRRLGAASRAHAAAKLGALGALKSEARDKEPGGIA